MKRINLLNLLYLTLIAMSIFSCKKDDDSGPEETTTSAESIFSVLGAIDGGYYLAQANNLNEGSLSFIGNGTQLDADQAARIISAGDFLYSLNYGTGLLTQLQPTADGKYNKTKEINVGLAVGTNKPRFALADKNTIMVYNVVVESKKDAGGAVIDNVSTLRLVSVSLPTLAINNLTQFVIPQSAEAAKGGTIGYEPMRVDAPVIAGDKIYFGLMHNDVSNPATPPPFRTPKQSGLETLVFDYPSFTNGALTLSSSASGHTGGYRGPSMHLDEKGDVYQSNWFMTGNKFDLSAGDKTVIMRLKDGKYDESYQFNISEALGLASNVGAVSWFYVGNGIGYMPIQLESEGDYYTANSWSVARIDIYNKTAVKLNVPLSNLFEMEHGLVKNGKFYMPISPFGGEAFVYEFDPLSSSADGFKTGLKISDSNVKVEGVY